MLYIITELIQFNDIYHEIGNFVLLTHIYSNKSNYLLSWHVFGSNLFACLIVTFT